MTDLTTDEETVLLIAARGERLIPIGRWKEPIEALVQRGLLVRECHLGDPTGHFNNVISPAGRAVVDALDSEFDKLLTNLKPQAVQHTRDKFRAEAEYIAGQLVALARESVVATGEDVGVALKNWTKAIAKRAREMASGS